MKRRSALLLMPLLTVSLLLSVSTMAQSSHPQGSKGQPRQSKTSKVQKSHTQPTTSQTSKDLSAQGPTHQNDEEAALWKVRVAPIVEGCTTDYQKARAIYDWVCQNIAYDMGKDIGDANTCWSQRRGICSGYSQLYIKLAQGCGLQAEEINGMAKTLSFANGSGPHAWVKVKTEKGWILLDATWGSGEVITGQKGTKQYKHQYRSFWFDIDPKWNIFTHFPKEADDQLLPSPISQEQYQRLPIFWPSMGEWGLNADSTLAYCLAHKGAKMPKSYDVPQQALGKMKLLEFPLSRTLQIGKSYRIVVETTDANYRPFSQPQTEWKQEGNRYTTTFKPTAKQRFIRLEIGETDGKGGWNVFTILEYAVEGKR